MLIEDYAVCGVTDLSAHPHISSRLYKEPGLAVLLEGQLFEPAHLASRLDVDAEAGHDGAARLLALAYRRWGESCADDLYGEFSFAVWDAAQRKLLLGRDATGLAPLYFLEHGDRMSFGTERHSLPALPGYVAALDERHLANAMSLRFAGEGRTLLRGVRYVPAGQRVVWQEGRATRWVEFFRPQDRPKIRAGDPREYAEALRSALVQAVVHRLPAEGPVASQLSSGYDSSGVTALVAQALAAQNRSLIAYTSVPAHQATDASAIMPGWFGDEWPLASQVATMYPNIEHIAIPTNAAAWMPALDAMSEVFNGPPAFIRNAPWIYAMHCDAKERGVRAMFNGQAGNLTASYDGNYALFDLRRRGDWAGLAKAVAWRRRKGVGWQSILRRMWMPSTRTRSRVRRLRGVPATSLFDDTLLRPDFYQAAGLPEAPPSPIGLPVDGDRSSGAAWRLSTMRMLDYGGMAGADRRLFGVQRFDPMADRRVVELCLAIPDDAYLMETWPRQLYRETMRRDLPPDLLRQKTSGLQSSDFLENFGESLKDFRTELEQIELSPLAGSVLDLPRMRLLLESWPADQTKDRAVLDLRYNFTFGGAIALGRYLRQMESGALKAG